MSLRKKYTDDVVTHNYRAPEVILSQGNYDHQIDMWSIGCILFELCNLKPMVTASTDLDCLLQIFALFGCPSEDSWPGVSQLPGFPLLFEKFPDQSPDQSRPQLVPTVDPQFQQQMDSLACSMLWLNPAQRITAAEAFDHLVEIYGVL